MIKLKIDFKSAVGLTLLVSFSLCEATLASTGQSCLPFYKIDADQIYSAGIPKTLKPIPFDAHEMARKVLQTLSSQMAQASALEPLIIEKIRAQAIQSLGLVGESAFNNLAGKEYFEKLTETINQSMGMAIERQARITETATELRKKIKDLKKQKPGTNPKNNTSELAQIKDIVESFEGLRVDGRNLSADIRSLQPIQTQIHGEVENLNNQLLLNRRLHEYLLAFSEQLLDMSQHAPGSLASERAISLVSLLAFSLQNSHTNIVLLGGFKSILENSEIQIGSLAASAKTITDLEINTFFMETGFGEAQAKALLAQYKTNLPPAPPVKTVKEHLNSAVETSKVSGAKLWKWAKTGTGIAVLSIAGFAGNHAINPIMDLTLESRLPKVVSALKMADEAASYTTRHAIIKDTYDKNYTTMTAADVKFLISRLDSPWAVTTALGFTSHSEYNAAKGLIDGISQHYAAFAAGVATKAESK